MKLINLFLVLFFLSTTSQAGWITFGGDNSIYAHNPWFSKNTTSVDYCVEVDGPSFSIAKAQILTLVKESFAYWKSEFASNFSINMKPGSGFVEVATQDFNYQATCPKDAPLIFKFGAKSLNADEKNHLVDVSKYIGATIRKNYDLKELKGDGIIYITADVGPDAYLNAAGTLIDKAWSKDNLLRYALIHEIGHFFGIPHVGAGIMSEVFMTILLDKKMAPEFVKAPQQTFLNFPKDFEVCRLTNQFNPDFFGVPSTSTCLKFEKISVSEWTVSSRPDVATTYTEVGVAQMLTLDQSPYSLKPAVMIQMPDEQTVFSAREIINGPFLIGAVFSDVSYSGSYRLKGAVRSIPLHMTLSADKVSFVGTVSSKQMTVMSYAPLSFLKTIFP